MPNDKTTNETPTIAAARACPFTSDWREARLLALQGRQFVMMHANVKPLTDKDLATIFADWRGFEIRGAAEVQS
jgi:hypothetical protein